MTSRTVLLILGLAVLAILSVTMLSRSPDHAVTEPATEAPAASDTAAPAATEAAPAEPAPPGASVEAPGVNVETDKATGDVKVQAPGVDVEKTQDGISVKAPGGVEIEVPAKEPAPATP